ncbi:hypothetical protein OE88DRAFT_1736013 [Heliocybe sulcata]|uniref:Uncharacterized protein n=1 Tax=Heliocybe sulcata TaxID=5364 RepID=A0A5C3N230_9AGAM|nr:hypothetical protein OE88DRAFT_1736013 [Heliocybe sulcata]
MNPAGLSTDSGLEKMLVDHTTDERHKEMDKEVEAKMRTFSLPKGQPLSHMAKCCLLSFISMADGLRLLDATEALALLEKYKQGLGQRLDEAWDAGEYKGIRRLVVLSDYHSLPQEPDTSSATTIASEKATEGSWTNRFRGEALVALKNHIAWHWDRGRTYVPYCSVVQSSGTGKSRTVDELSKESFVIPMNLRQPNEKGYPPSDKQLHRFFSVEQLDRLSSAQLFHYVSAFVVALLRECKNALEGKKMAPSQRPEWFRSKMSEGQTMDSHGTYRIQFYNRVVAKAKSLYEGREGSPKSANCSVHDAATDLTSLLGFQGRPEDHRPALYLSFDEAHILTRPGLVEYDDTGPLMTPFAHLRRVLCSLRSFRIFALFLSTTGKISPFMLPKEGHPPDRVQTGRLALIPPFCVLGWDMFVKPEPDRFTLEDVSQLSHQVRLGRPLFASRYISSLSLHREEKVEIQDNLVSFAAQKLIKAEINPDMDLTKAQQLACLALRMPIELMSSTQAERDQVANHMRVCLSASNGFRTILTLNPSEPILSEGAVYVMKNLRNFNSPVALLNVLNGFAVKQGDRGELIALLLLTLARDQAVDSRSARSPGLRTVFGLVPFLRALFKDQDILKATPSRYRCDADRDQKLEDVFADDVLHFNHFVKRHEQEGLDSDVLAGYLSRNAAVMCPDSQAEVAMVLPMVRGGPTTVVSKASQAVILVQVNNDSGYAVTIDENLFEIMDPVKLGVFEESQSERPPIIRIIFALAGETPSTTYVRRQEKASFTAYDIWVSGLSSDVFGVIKDENDDGTWDNLLRASYGWRKMYDDPNPASQRLLKNMNPLAASDEEFWAFTKNAGNNRNRVGYNPSRFRSGAIQLCNPS